MSPSPSASAEIAKRIKELIKEPHDIYDFKNLTNAGERQDAARLDELRKVFLKLIAEGDLQRSSNKNDNSSFSESKITTSDAKAKWNLWLDHQHSKFVDQLCDRIRLGRKHALRTFCGVIASSPVSNSSSTATVIDEQLVMRLVEALCVRSSKKKNSSSKKRKRDDDDDEEEEYDLVLSTDEPMLNLLQTEFIRPYRDAQYYMLLGIRELALKIPGAREYKVDENSEKDKFAASAIAENILNLLMRIDIAALQEELDNGSYLIKPPELPPAANSKATKKDDENENSSDEGGYDSNEETDSESEDESATAKPKNKFKPKTLISAKTDKKKRRQKDSRLYVQILNRHRRLLGETWLSCLNVPHMPLKSHKRALQYIPKHILPIMRNPLRLAEYMTKSYQMGGITALLALNGLFILMTKHGLEYPQFYSSLYALIGPKIFYAKHRTRFFQLLNICLSKSQMLPAYLVAAFCKRLCHAALSAPPSGALFTLALVSNLLRKHKECACLIHRGGGEMVEDTFDVETDDPSQCRGKYVFISELSIYIYFFFLHFSTNITSLIDFHPILT